MTPDQGSESGELPSRTARSPWIFAVVIAGLAASVVPWMAVAVGPHVGFLPAVIAVVTCLDLLSVYLLVEQFRADGDPRILAMAVAYSWSLIIMLGYAGAFPGVVAAKAPLSSAPSVAPWLYVIWHSSFPILLALAWVPWPGRMSTVCPLPKRRRLAILMPPSALLLGAAVVALVVAEGPALPVLISGVDTSRMTSLTAPVTLPLVTLSAVMTAWALRRRTGPERWTAVAVWVCLLDLTLTYASGHRYSLGWYTGRALTVIAAAVVLAAMLRETTRLKLILAAALRRQREVETLQRTILDHLHESVILTDSGGQLLMMNAPARVMLPHLQPGTRPSAPVLHTPAGDLVPEENRPTVFTARTGLPLRDELLVLTTPAGPRWLTVNTASVPAAGKAHSVLTSIADVSDRERSRQEIEQLADELEVARDAAVAADRAKSSFLAATSHEIRTPLNGLLGFTGLLARTTLDPKQTEFVTLAQTCGQQLLALLNDVLDFSKADAGQLRLELAELDMLNLIDDTLAIVAESAGAKGLAICGVIAADVPRYLLGDDMRLRQALLNLLSNAVKFTDAGGIELEVTYHDGLARFAVHDSGLGVDPQAVPALFEPFTQAQTGTARLYGGTGLGLAITREIARLHGGTADARPRPEGGSTFWFSSQLRPTGKPETKVLRGVGVRVVSGDDAQRRRLEQLVLRAGGRPGADVTLSTSDDEQGGLTVPLGATCRQVLHLLAGSPHTPVHPLPPLALTGLVLVAEDNTVNQRMVSLLLEGLGLAVRVVDDGAKAVTAAVSEHFSVILMDCQMGGTDGLEATRQLRAQGCRTPIIALTAAASRDNELACRAAGMDDYLSKPIDVAALGATLQRHLCQPTDRRPLSALQNAQQHP